MNPADPFGLVDEVLDGQIRVERLVGEGGFSAVYRGQHQGLDEPVAIKCLKLPPSLGPELVETFVHRFRDESRLLYRLSQGNLHIVRSITAGSTQSKTAGFTIPYMVLEWLEGRTLAADFAVRRESGETGRSIEETIALFGTAADALSFAHGQGVVHRDLNPGNFFLVESSQGMKMKVLDFGVAKILDDSTVNIGPRTQTMGLVRIFAPAYGAPEQFDDSIGKIGAQSDVYSFALVLMEAMRDRTVNDASSLAEFLATAVDAKKRPTPRALGMDVSDAVEAVFARATQLNPRDRFADVGELWRAFTAAVLTSKRRSIKRSDPPSAAGPQKEVSAAPRPPSRPAPNAPHPVPKIVPKSAPKVQAALDRTLPLSSARGVPLRGSPSAPTAGANIPTPKMPMPAVSREEAQRLAGIDDDGDDIPTNVDAPAFVPAQDEEYTRIRPPEPEVLRDLKTPVPPRAAPALAGTLMMGARPQAQQATPVEHDRVTPVQPFAGTVALAQPPAQSLPAGQPLSAQMYQPMPAPYMGHHPAQQPWHAGTGQVPPHFAPPLAFDPARPRVTTPTIALIVAAAAFVIVSITGVLVYALAGRRPAELTATEASAPKAPEPVPQPSAEPAPPAPVEAIAAVDEADAEALVVEETSETPAPEATAATAATVSATASAVPVPKPAAEPDAGNANAWSESAARTRLSQANGVLVICRRADGITGPGSAMVTFGPDGTVTSVIMDAPYAGTKEGECVAGQFRRAKINAFEGSPQSLRHSFEVPQ